MPLILDRVEVWPNGVAVLLPEATPPRPADVASTTGRDARTPGLAAGIKAVSAARHAGAPRTGADSPTGAATALDGAALRARPLRSRLPPAPALRLTPGAPPGSLQGCSRDSTASVSSPRSGARRVMAPGVRDSLGTMPGTCTVRPSGVVTGRIMSRAWKCGSAAMSAAV